MSGALTGRLQHGDGGRSMTLRTRRESAPAPNRPIPGCHASPRCLCPRAGGGAAAQVRTRQRKSHPVSYKQLLKQQCYIGGAWCDDDSRKTMEVTGPGKGTVLGAFPNMGEAETARTIPAAEGPAQAGAGDGGG